MRGLTDCRRFSIRNPESDGTAIPPACRDVKKFSETASTECEDFRGCKTTAHTLRQRIIQKIDSGHVPTDPGRKVLFLLFLRGIGTGSFFPFFFVLFCQRSGIILGTRLP